MMMMKLDRALASAFGGPGLPVLRTALKGMPARIAVSAALSVAVATLTASAPVRTPVVQAPPPPPSPAELARSFALAAPPAEALGADLRLWGTHYHTEIVSPAAGGMESISLIGRDDSAISAGLSVRDWCAAALQGSVSVKRLDGPAKTYVYVDSNGPEQADCDQYLGQLPDGVKLATRRARFKPLSHPMGCGTRRAPLMPFRTIAVDPAVIPMGRVIFVPQLRGLEFTLDGKAFTHDGYLIAGDRGGAVEGRHIDVFTTEDTPLEELFSGSSTDTFDAYPVASSDPMAQALKGRQGEACGVAPGLKAEAAAPKR
jgi:3D (Asp-Asp-Asp) domain-containing protein